MTVGSDPSGPLRIAYLTYRGKPHVGGQGVYTRHLTKALVDLGHHVEVFGGQPYPVLASGRFEDVSTTGSLRILRCIR